MRNSGKPLVKFFVIYFLIGAILAFLAAVAALFVDFIVLHSEPGTVIFTFLILAAIIFAVLSMLFISASIYCWMALLKMRDDAR